MRKLIPTAFGLYLAATGVAGAQEGKATQKAEPDRSVLPAPTADQKLATAISEKLRSNSKLKNYRVDLDVSDGVAEVNGLVASQAQRDEVVRTVQAVPGVKHIRDNLLTGDGHGMLPPATLPAPTAKSAKAPARTETKGVVKAEAKASSKTDAKAIVRTAAKEPASIETGDPASPSTQLARIIAERLRANKKLQHYRVDLDVSEGVVDLNGQVTTEAQRDEVIRTLQSVAGVRHIRDKLVVGDERDTTPVATAEPPVQNKTVSATPVSQQSAPAPQQVAPQQISDVATTQSAPVLMAEPTAAQPSSVPVFIGAPQSAQVPMFVGQPVYQPAYQPAYQQSMPLMAWPMQSMPMQAMPMQSIPMQGMPMQAMPMQQCMPTQAVAAPGYGAQPGYGAAPGAGGPPEPLPIFQAQPGMPNPQLQPPPMPPHAWPTYAPYNNVSRVAYPNNYPYEAWPFIGPMYPFPKVPLGWRSVTLSWRDGYWWYGKEASGHDWWRVRYW